MTGNHHKVPRFLLSCVLDLCNSRKIPLEQTFRDSFPGELHHHDGNSYMKWRDLAKLLSRVARFLDEQELREMGRSIWSSGTFSLQASIGRAMFNTHEQFLAVFGMSGLCSTHFPLETHVQLETTDRLTLKIRMREGAQVCSPFFYMLSGLMEGLTETVGLPRAVVSMRPASRGAIYSIEYRERWRPLTSLHRACHWMKDYFAITREFVLMKSELRSGSAELARDEPDESGHENIRLKEEMSQQARSFRSITDMAPDAIIIFDEQFRITYASPASTSVFGYNYAEFIGMNIKHLLAETSDRVQNLYQMEPASALTEMGAQGIHKNRDLVPLEIFASSQELGEARLTTCIIKNLSIRKKMEREKENLERQLQVSQKMESMGQLSGGVAHDFNNLLIAILGYTDLAMQDDDNLENYLAEIRKAGERGTAMTRKLLTFGGRKVIEQKLVEADEIIKGVREMITRLLPGNIEMAFSNQVTDAWLLADVTQIEQVLVNLAVNARDAMPSGGRISIRLLQGQGAQSDYTIIEIIDTGSGMDEEVLAHIFEPFYTTKPEGSGTGLGLAIVFSIIEQHNGFIDVESTLGTGTRFQIHLPTAKAAPVADVSAPDQTAGGNETLLVVEDNAQIRDLTKLILTGDGYSVLEAGDGQAGIDQYTRHAADIDLIIMDIVMPKLGGRDAARIIRQAFPDARILFTSGYGTDSPQTRFIEEQRLPIMPKPYSGDTLRAQVRRMLDDPQSSPDMSQQSSVAKPGRAS